MINFKLPWPPTVNTYWRATSGPAGLRVHISDKGRKYKENAVLEMMAQGVSEVHDARVSVLIDCYPPDRRKRDLDNLTKPLLDVMEDYGVFNDDEQVDILTIRRRGKGGYVIVHVAEIDPEDSLTS